MLKRNNVATVTVFFHVAADKESFRCFSSNVPCSIQVIDFRDGSYHVNVSNSEQLFDKCLHNPTDFPVVIHFPLEISTHFVLMKCRYINIVKECGAINHLHLKVGFLGSFTNVQVIGTHPNLTLSRNKIQYTYWNNCLKPFCITNR